MHSLSKIMVRVIYSAEDECKEASKHDGYPSVGGVSEVGDFKMYSKRWNHGRNVTKTQIHEAFGGKQDFKDAERCSKRWERHLRRYQRDFKYQNLRCTQAARYFETRQLRCIPVMATAVLQFVFTTENRFIHLAPSSKDKIPGHFGQSPWSIGIFFLQFLDEHEVDRKRFTRGGHYLASDWMARLPNLVLSNQRPLRASGTTPRGSVAANSCRLRLMMGTCSG
jgi:hypothetical protein